MLNGDMETIIPALFRKVTAPAFSRERITTPDGDFLDLDWHRQQSDKLVILSHGLEGDSQRPYIKGMAKTFAAAGYDVLAWNYRGCSGEINQTLRAYHSGATEDLQLVLDHVRAPNFYREISLIGFSLGGNLTLKYLGEMGHALPPEIKGAVTVSVPCNLHESAVQLGRFRNRMYQKRFLRSLRGKLRAKQKVNLPHNPYPDHARLTDFFSFDDYYTAPVHGFANAEAYYKACSSVRFLSGIQVPALILNAANDPFLTPGCFPVQQAKNSDTVFLEMPARGGHVGFCTHFAKDRYYSESRALRFVSEIGSGKA